MLRGLDTNILVYALAARDEEKRRIAANILREAVEYPNDYVVSVQVLAETIYVILRKAPEVREEAVRLVELLSRTLKVVNYASSEILQASGAPPRYYWDRLLAYTYRNNGVEEIVTEDEKPYRGILRIAHPFAK